MKYFKLSMLTVSVLISNSIFAAEIYNKDGNKLNLNGKVEAVYLSRDLDDNYKSFDNEDKTLARIGFNGVTQINSELTGYAKLEHEYIHDNSKQETRYSYVGLNFGKYGSLDFGRNLGVVAMIRDITDKSARFGGNGFGGGTDVFMTGRSSGLATYSNNDFFGLADGLNIYIQYQAKKSASNGFSKSAHGDGVAFTSIYEHADSGLGFGITYSASDRLENQRQGKIDSNGVASGTNGKKAEIWGTALMYDANQIYAAVTYAQSKNMILVHGSNEFASSTRGIEAILAYNFEFGLTPTLHYNHLKGQDLKYNALTYTNGQDSYDADINKYIGIGTKYRFSKNMDMAVGYKINLLDDDLAFTKGASLSSDDQFEARITYSF